MAFPFSNSNTQKGAAIIRAELDQVEVSPDFPGVPAANAALSTHLAGIGAVVINKDINDWDGHEVTALEKTQKPGVWHEVDYTVLPTSEI